MVSARHQTLNPGPGEPRSSRHPLLSQPSGSRGTLHLQSYRRLAVHGFADMPAAAVLHDVTDNHGCCCTTLEGVIIRATPPATLITRTTTIEIREGGRVSHKRWVQNCPHTPTVDAVFFVKNGRTLTCVTAGGESRRCGSSRLRFEAGVVAEGVPRKRVSI